MSEETAVHTFHTPSPVNLRVEFRQGEVDIRAEQTDTTTVELAPLRGDQSSRDLIEATTVEQRGDDIVVLMPKVKGGLFRRGGEIAARIVVPVDSAVSVETVSADLTTSGTLGDTHVASGSGDVVLDVVAACDLKTGSGDVQVSRVTGSCDIKSGSADVAIGVVEGDANLLTGSGDVEVTTVGGALKVKAGSGDVIVKDGGASVEAMAGSGDVLLKRVSRGRVRTKTGSGDITIGVASGTAAFLDVMSVSGDVSTELDGAEPPSDDDQTVEISAQSGSGDVVLQRA